MIKVTNKVMNKVFYSISDKYGWEEVPYVYSDSIFNSKTTHIEICMWRYDVKFIKDLFIENGIDIDVNKDSIYTLNAYNDIYNKKD